MKCWKCTNPAVVHMTDIVGQSDGSKQAMEVHLCLAHALEAGLVANPELLKNIPSPPSSPPTAPTASPVAETPHAAKPPLKAPTTVHPTSGATGPTEIVAKNPTSTSKPPIPPGGLTVVRKDTPTTAGDQQACPVCGLTYGQFKKTGLMGCPHDYVAFEGRLLPLIKRAQEHFTQHAGKVPVGREKSDPGMNSVMVARLRRELTQALAAEDYEQAAQLRDQLKALGETK